jgi:hypothetical protein
VNWTFAYGLAGFILVAILIDQYDQAHGTGYLWGYTFIIGAGLAIAHSGTLASGLTALQNTATGAPRGTTTSA